MRCNFPENHSFSQVGHIGMNVNYTPLMKRSQIGSFWPLPELDFGSGGVTSHSQSAGFATNYRILTLYEINLEVNRVRFIGIGSSWPVPELDFGSLGVTAARARCHQVAATYQEWIAPYHSNCKVEQQRFESTKSKLSNAFMMVNTPT